MAELRRSGAVSTFDELNYFYAQLDGVMQRLQTAIELSNFALGLYRRAAAPLEAKFGDSLETLASETDAELFYERKWWLDAADDPTLPWPPAPELTEAKLEASVRRAVLQFDRFSHLAELELLDKLFKRIRREKNIDYQTYQKAGNSRFALMELSRNCELFVKVDQCVRGIAIPQYYLFDATGVPLHDKSKISASWLAEEEVLRNAGLKPLERSQAASDDARTPQTLAAARTALPWYMPAYSEPFALPEMQDLREHREQLQTAQSFAAARDWAACETAVFAAIQRELTSANH